MVYRVWIAGGLSALLLTAAQPAYAQEEAVRGAEAEVERIAAQARAAFGAGRYRDALILLRDVHAFSAAELGAEHPLTLQALSNIAALQQVQGNTEAALPLALAAAGGLERAAGPDHPDTLNALANLAQLHIARGEQAAAEPLLRRVYSGRQRTLGADHEATLEGLLELAAFLNRAGRIREVRSDLERALQAARTKHGSDSPIATDLAAAAAVAAGRQPEPGGSG
jgi:hypothetical protein